ncbi:MAG: type I restriction endonuclease subunit R [Akkermansia sp.]
MSFTENNFEQAIIELFRDQLGYDYHYGPEVNRDYRDPFDCETVLEYLEDVNPSMPLEALNEALEKLRSLDGGMLVQKNEVFMDYVQNGIAVKYHHEEIEKTGIVYVIDYKHPDRNHFEIVNQWTFVEHSEKRADMVVFVNGLPLVVIELKSPSREEADVSQAYRQLRNYIKEIPSLFIYNAFLVMSDHAESRAGTITAAEGRFMEWKTVDGSYENTQHASFDVFFEGMFEKKRFLDLLKNYLCFSHEDEENVKILAGYHQYFAVNKAIESTKKAIQTDGKGGVFWHTQGSGKSLSMVFYSHLLQEHLDSPTIVVLTDRNDLDDQLYGQFAKCQDFLRQSPQRAENRAHLKDLLAHREANGIIFTTMQKFEESEEALSERRNIIVIADEAHRSQYGLTEKMDNQTGKITIGTARIIRDSLPNATYIGFTGTPLSSKDRDTKEIFGNYIDIYDMTQAVEDGATRPVYYESRVIKLNLKTEVLEQIDVVYGRIAEKATEYAVEKSKRELGRMDSILGAPQAIESLCADIIEHYENNRQDELTGKALIVAYSRGIALDIYRKILELRPEWQEKIAVVMTSGNNDPEEWGKIIGNASDKKNLARRFKDDQDSLKIAIVVDMWLTGFDVPSLATMYVYKPMSGHNLMQAIARVNRVFKDKEGGLVVDYVGIASDLKQAMNDYTRRDQKNYGDPDIGKVALPRFEEHLSICRDQFYGYDYSAFLNESDLQRAKVISGGVNFLSDISRERHKNDFIREAHVLRQALSLCKSLVSREQRYEAAYFEAVRTILTRVAGTGKISLKEINDQINELLKQSIKSDGVINLFSDVKKEFSLFDPKFLEEIAKMKERNLALELLRRLIEEQVKLYKHTNLVKSEKFSEILSRLMKSYLNGMLSNEQVIEELLKLAQELSMAHAEGEQLGLSPEELAFYDALTKPAAIQDFYNNDELISLTKELTELLRKNRTIDWQKKETARAEMRMLVKRLLRRHKYPPEGLEDALATVIRQCETWTDYPLIGRSTSEL